MQKLNLLRDIQGVPTQANHLRPFAPVRESVTLSASTAASFTVPASHQNWALFISCSPTVSVWVSINSTAAVPAGATFAATTSVKNPPGLLVQAGDVISVISATASTDVGLELYPLST